jgi:hypothetical protein
MSELTSGTLVARIYVSLPVKDLVAIGEGLELMVGGQACALAPGTEDAHFDVVIL